MRTSLHETHPGSRFPAGAVLLALALCLQAQACELRTGVAPISAPASPSASQPPVLQLQCAPWLQGDSAPTGAAQPQKPPPTDAFQTMLLVLERLTQLLAVIAWPLAALAVAFGLRPQILALLGRVKQVEIGQNRIILDSLRPAPLREQQEKSRQEAQEAGEAMQAARPSSSSTVRAQRHALLAEDLALRAIQEEYGCAIRRQVKAPDGPVFDGVFVNEGRLYIVEVKYLRGGPLSPRLRESLAALSGAVRARGWRSTTLLLVAVFDGQDAAARVRQLRTLASDADVPVIVRSFEMSELKARFEPSEGDG